MITRDELMARGDEMREEMIARREALMERADDIRAQFADNVDADAVTVTVGLTLVSTGVALAVTQWIRGRRGMAALAVPVLLLLVGSTLAGGGAKHRRDTGIGEAEVRVRAELASLDPFARARVLKDMASEQLRPLMHHSHN